MLEKITPEEAGISSSDVCGFISALERRDMRMHSVLLMKGDKLFAEYYWAPFDADFNHRMYSQTKSYVAFAIGLCEEDGLLSLDDKIADHFPEKIDSKLADNLKNLTIREMLTMTTAGQKHNWFTAGDPDRVHRYFRDKSPRATGTIWEYDSAGSQVLGVLVEKLTGKKLFDFLNERIFRHLGAFKNATMLKTPNGDSWADSALICTPRDMITFARFIMNGGVWNGKRLLNEEYIKAAVSKQVDNSQNAHGGAFRHGYGYQVWRTEMNGYAFNGMGSQFTVSVPEKDLIFVCTADTQGNDFAGDYILYNFFDRIASKIEEAPMPKNIEAERMLHKLTSELKLFSVRGADDSPMREKLDGVRFECNKNPLGMKDFVFNFKDASSGVLVYTNDGGKMELPFKINANEFCKFPELGYSNECGGIRTTDGFKYDSAVSAAWLQENKIIIFIQIIDKYFGTASMIFAFKGKEATVTATKRAEDFLWNYEGEANAHIAEESI